MKNKNKGKRRHIKEGWADKRIDEKLDRGLIAQRCEDGSVYIDFYSRYRTDLLNFP